MVIGHEFYKNKIIEIIFNNAIYEKKIENFSEVKLPNYPSLFKGQTKKTHFIQLLDQGWSN